MTKEAARAARIAVIRERVEADPVGSLLETLATIDAAFAAYPVVVRPRRTATPPRCPTR
jgi:hypothetical protein